MNPPNTKEELAAAFDTDAIVVMPTIKSLLPAVKLFAGIGKEFAVVANA